MANDSYGVGFEESWTECLPATLEGWFCRIFLSVFLVASFSALSATAFEFTGKVVRVVDGDTIYVLNERRLARIRLANIDCPEKSQPFGKQAKSFTSALAYDAEVTILSSPGIVPALDRYGRIIGSVLLPDGSCLNEDLLRAGYAWQYSRYSNDPDLNKLEQEARSLRLGLWADPTPVPPWQYRSIQRKSHKPVL